MMNFNLQYFQTFRMVKKKNLTYHNNIVQSFQWLIFFLRKHSGMVHKDIKHKCCHFLLSMLVNCCLDHCPFTKYLLNAYSVPGTKFWGQRDEYNRPGSLPSWNWHSSEEADISILDNSIAGNSILDTHEITSDSDKGYDKIKTRYGIKWFRRW